MQKTNQIHPAIPIQHSTQTCDGQADRQTDRQRAIDNTALWHNFAPVKKLLDADRNPPLAHPAVPLAACVQRISSVKKQQQKLVVAMSASLEVSKN